VVGRTRFRNVTLFHYGATYGEVLKLMVERLSWSVHSKSYMHEIGQVYPVVIDTVNTKHLWAPAPGANQASGIPPRAFLKKLKFK
jgi:hypothetical protein